MKKIYFILGALFTMPLFSFGQFLEFGVFGGGSTYMGELTPNPIQFSQINGAYGVLIRYNINNKWTLKGNAYFGTISGSDAQDGTSAFSKDRNLSFKSYIYDFSGQIEWNILGFQAGYKKDKVSPYLFAGFSVFTFDPTADYKGETIRLQPLGTEGQNTTKYNDREKYALTQISIPMGIGLKINTGGPINIGFEVGMRKTFTDYLDDVSTSFPAQGYLDRNTGRETAEALSNRSGENYPEPNNSDILVRKYGQRKIKSVDGKEPKRGNPDSKDWYAIGGITITYTILRPQCPRW